MNEVLKIRYEKLGPKVVSALEKKGFEAYYCTDKDDALSKVLALIPETASVAYGGSLTLNALHVKETLRQRGNHLIDRDLASDIETRTALEHEAFTSDYFLMSSNAISEDGQLVNIDGIGNRVGALIYGPKHVIIISGMNKVVKTLEDAYGRARNIAAPSNMQRFPKNQTPCNLTGACADCNSADCICNQIVVTRRSNPPKRIKVILIGEEIGL